MSLLKLPRELRNHIYAHVLNQSERRNLQRNNRIKLEELISCHLSIACKQIRRELVEEWQLHGARVDVSGSPNFCERALEFRFGRTYVWRFIRHVDMTLVSILPRRRAWELRSNASESFRCLPDTIKHVLHALLGLLELNSFVLRVESLAAYANIYNIEDAVLRSGSSVIQKKGERDMYDRWERRRKVRRHLLLRTGVQGLLEVLLPPIKAS